MSEDRNLRLENAMATLAEISAQHSERLAAIERSNLRLENSLQTLTELAANQSERVNRVETSLQTLTELAVSQSGRINGVENSIQTLTEVAADQVKLMANLQRRVKGLEESSGTVVELLQSHHDGMTELRAAQADADAKIAALADAQIRTEATLERSNERLQLSLSRLAESQAHSDRRLDALIDIVRGGRNGRSES